MLRRVGSTTTCPSALVGLQRWCSTSHPQGSFVVGNTASAQPPKRSDETVCEMNDVVGLNFMSNEFMLRLPAGELLGLMDACAARTAMKHVTGRFLPPSAITATVPTPGDAPPMRISVATVAATDMSFRFPLIHGDMANLVGTVVNTGKSSVTVDVSVHRTAFPHRHNQCVGRAFFFMVAIDSKLKSAPVVPPLLVMPQHAKLHDLAISQKQEQNQLDVEITKIRETPDSIFGDDNILPRLETDINRNKLHKIRIEDTTMRANRLFFPGHLNLNKTIFGGELMRWMELHACQCGRMFTRNKRVFSLRMSEITFNHPVNLDDWVSLEAAVVFVQNTTLVVDVQLFIEDANSGRVTTNEASFVLTNFDDVGQRQIVDYGLDLSSASPSWRKRYAIAKARYATTNAKVKGDGGFTLV